MSENDYTYCECGALIKPGDDKCPVCKKPVEEIKTENNNCHGTYNGTKHVDSSNKIANILKFIGIIAIIASIIAGIYFYSEYYITRLSLYIILTGVVTGIFIIGFSEIINLLQKIYYNTQMLDKDLKKNNNDLNNR